MTKEEIKRRIESYNFLEYPWKGNYINTLTWKEYLDCSPEEGWVDFSYHVTSNGINRIGTLHGGVVAAVLDEAMGYAALAFAEDGIHPTTSDMQYNCLKAMMEGDELRVRCMLCHKGKRTMVFRSEMWRGEELCAAATENFSMIDMKKIDRHIQEIQE